MKCDVCAGACCETITLPMRLPGSNRQWIELHAIAVKPGAVSEDRTLTFEARCTALTNTGTCSIYEARPHICRVYPAGGPACIATARARRTPEHYARIRDEEDPP